MKAPKPKSTYEPVPAGTHVARLYQIIHIGTNSFEFKGETKQSDKVRLTFEVPGEMREFGEEKEVKPMSISREFGFSMGKKSHLRPFVEGMLGTALADDEAYDFDIEKLLGETCLISVVHEAGRDGGTYAAIQSASALMRNMKAPDAINEAKLIDVNTATKEEIDALPGFIRDKMKTSIEYTNRFGDGSDIQLGQNDSINPDDNPF